MKYILALFLLLFLGDACAQDSASRFAFTSSFYGGVPFQHSRYTSDWYTPNFEVGFTQTFSIRLKNRFFVTFGAGINHREYRTKPAFGSYVTYDYDPAVGGYVINYFEEGFAMQGYGRYTQVNVPLLLEYMPIGKWTPYARAGIVFDAVVRERESQVFAHNDEAVYGYNYLSETDVHSEDFSLSASFSGGMKFGNRRLELLMGVSTQVGLNNFNSFDGANRISVVGEVGVRKTISSEKFPHQQAVKVDTTKFTKKNFFYLEALGSVLFASVNYERTIFTSAKNRVHGRIGFSFDNFGSDYNQYLPVGLLYIYGRKHGFEVGGEYVQVFGDKASYFTSHLGYRIEMNQGVLLRFNAVGQFMSSRQFRLVPGASVGFRF